MLSQRFSNILVLSSILFFTFCTAVKQDLRTINYNKEAFKRQRSGDYTGSINVCREAIKYDPKNSWAHALMGNAYIGLKKYDEALIEFDTAIALNNKNTYYKYCRAFAFEGLRKYDESIADDDYCIAKNYLKACAYNNKGVTKDKVKKYKEALQEYDSCLAVGAYYHQFVRLNKASVFCKLQEYDSALEEVNRCIKQDPLQLSMPAHFKNTSEQNLLLKKDAIMKDTSFLKDIKLYENAYSFKGLLCMMFGKNKDACNSFYHEPAIPLPDYYNLLMRGYFALDNMQYDSAKILIDSSLAVNSENSNTFVGLGLLNTLTRKYDDALAAYNLAINTDSTNPDAFVGRGNMYLQMDNYPAAIADYTTEINLDYRIQNTTAYNARGYAYFLNKQYKEALADYDSAKSVSKHYYQPLFDYKEEAKKALSTGENSFVTLIQWKSPVLDVNNLVDNAQFHVSAKDPMLVNLKIVTNHPFNKEKLFAMLDGQSIPEGNNGDVKVVKEDAAANKYEYEYSLGLNLSSRGKHPFYLSYNGKSSQTIALVVE